MSHPESSNQVHVGAVVPARKLATVAGDRIAVPDAELLTHLQFRRFAGCPVCNLHLRSMARRHDEIVAAGVREVVVFHSSDDDLRTYVTDLPFALIGDPSRRLYKEFGVEASPRSLLDPRAWWPIARSVLHASAVVITRRGPLPPLKPPGGRFGLPGDFLLAPDGQVLAAHYGSHADDQWSVDDLLRLVPTVRR